MFPNVVIHDNDSFDPVKVVSEYLRIDPDELKAIKDKYASASSKRRECARECYKRKNAKLSDEERKTMYKRKSRDYYSKNADMVKERNLLKYKNDEEYRLRLSLQSKDKYQQKKIESRALSCPLGKVDATTDNDTQTDNTVDVKADTDTNGDSKVDVKADTDAKPKNNKIQVSFESLLDFKPPGCTNVFEGITKDIHKYRVDFKHPDGPRLEINVIYLNNDGVRYEYCDWKD